ncbi:hypothetical protein [Paenibacillus xylanivorans]|uniref:Uncharacterized protein n=1 Tax=Paenibacillus xylanivorans TaxID=1705561 RepID=A0A0M9BKR2_9BACL|nr:hypothetical protein [Paenibacillus xylanivorans]KOY14320.1 hypothetical protein AMS66_20175 [Paenibacillus xylanivorans]
MKKKIVALSLATVLAAVPVSSAFASTSENPLLVNQQTSITSISLTAEQQDQLTENLNALSIIDKYVTLNDDNFYELDEEALNYVGQEVFDSYSRGMALTNEALANNLVKIENGQLVSNMPAVVKSLKNDQGTIQPFASAESYWWGINFKLSNQESKTLAYNIKTQANWATAIFGLTGILNPPALLIAVITQFGATAFVNELEYNTNSLGVNVDVSYVGTVSMYPRAT